jgi:site-specific recombinase XerD
MQWTFLCCDREPDASMRVYFGIDVHITNVPSGRGCCVFDKLLKDRRFLTTYQTGPLAAERQRFLEQLDELGYAKRRLSQINVVLFAIANCIASAEQQRYSVRECEAVAKNWVKNRPDRGASAKSRKASETEFLFYMKRWLKFLDRLDDGKPPTPFAAELEAFLSHLQVERGFTETTIDNRRDSLSVFFQWLANDQVISLQQVDLDHVSRFQAVGKSRGWKRTTISFHTQSLRTFLRYTNSRGWSSVAVGAITAPRLYAYEGLPEGPKWPDVKSLLENENGDSPVRIRNRAMFLLFARYGFRVSEVRLLELDDLDWDKERIVLRRSKLRRAHEYPLDREVGDAILRYLQDVRPRSNHQRVFLSLRQPYRPLSTGAIGTQVQKRLRRISARFGSYGPHALRHACAKQLLTEGFSIKQIGDHLGHVSVVATQLYAKVDLSGLREVGNLDMSELVAYAEHAQRNQTPLLPRDSIEGLREVAAFQLGSLQ